MATDGTVVMVSGTCANGCNMTLDSGMPYISGPSEEIQALQDFIGAKKEPDGDVCDYMQHQVLFNVTSYTISVENFEG